MTREGAPLRDPCARRSYVTEKKRKMFWVSWTASKKNSNKPNRNCKILSSNVADPDPQDPYVFGPPGSGSISQKYGSRSRSGSFYHQAIITKTLIPTLLWLLYDFLSLENDVNVPVPSRSNKQKNLTKKNFQLIWIRGSGSVPKISWMRNTVFKYDIICLRRILKKKKAKGSQICLDISDNMFKGRYVNIVRKIQK
jgi:hypothetical protein